MQEATSCLVKIRCRTEVQPGEVLSTKASSIGQEERIAIASRIHDSQFNISSTYEVVPTFLPIHLTCVVASNFFDGANATFCGGDLTMIRLMMVTAFLVGSSRSPTSRPCLPMTWWSLYLAAKPHRYHHCMNLIALIGKIGWQKQVQTRPFAGFVWGG